MGMFSLLLTAIQLIGVEGTDLRARAFFDANNVKVGDPMVLTIDFLGEADFKDLHPPALAKVVGKGDWKLDDVSAKTDTFRDARRLTYRVRPMREGVLWFPALEFEYEGPDGAKRITRSNEIPVHAKGGAQVNMDAEMSEDANEMPKPPALVSEFLVSGSRFQVSEDVQFAWKRAMAKPTADAFAEFDFPAARMNEATCAIREGNWARAMKIYQKLEWTTGQTPEMEQGIVAALALRYDNPAVELPVWRVCFPACASVVTKSIVRTSFSSMSSLFVMVTVAVKRTVSASRPNAVSASSVQEVIWSNPLVPDRCCEMVVISAAVTSPSDDSAAMRPDSGPPSDKPRHPPDRTGSFQSGCRGSHSNFPYRT